MMRTRWNRAISILALRRRRSAPAGSDRRFALMRRMAAQDSTVPMTSGGWRRAIDATRACRESLFLPRPKPSFWSKPKDETGHRRGGGFANGFIEHLALDSGPGGRPAAVRRTRQDLRPDGRLRQGHQVVQEGLGGGRQGRGRAGQDRAAEDDRPSAATGPDRNDHAGGDPQGELTGSVTVRPRSLSARPEPFQGGQ